MVYCTNCGRRIPNEVKFCPYCGTSTGNAGTRSDYAASQDNRDPGAYSTHVGGANGRRRTNLLIIIIAICLVVIAAVLIARGGGSSNVLMRLNVHKSTYYSDLLGNFDICEELDSVLGNTRYSPDEIVTVTFLDTLKNKPSDAWDVSEKQNGSVMAWVVSSSRNGWGYDLYIAGKGGVEANPNSCCLFYGYANLVSIDFNDCFYTGNITDMSWMFADCESLKTLDLSNWDTSRVTDMSWMFGLCSSLRELGVRTWDTSRVTDMSCMFAECWDLEKLDVSNWDTSRVTDMSWMFENCESLLDLDLSAWNMSQADTRGMFYGADW